MKKALILTTIFVFACGITLSSIMAFAQEDYNIPEWIKNNAGWWATDQIDDASFVSGIKYMIENGIMEISQGAQSTNTVDSLSVQKIQDNGDFIMDFQHGLWVPYQDRMMYTEYFEEQVVYLNDVFRLPYDVMVMIVDSTYDPECNTPTMFYHQRHITVCHEFMEETDRMFLEYYGNDIPQGEICSGNPIRCHDVLDSSARGVLDHTFYHVIGHALIDIYDLPYIQIHHSHYGSITPSSVVEALAPQEDAADQFGVYVLTEYSEGYIGHAPGDSAQVDAAGGREFPRLAPNLDVVAIKYGVTHYTDDELVVDHFVDTHSFSIQRLFNLFCYAYWSDPVSNVGLIPMIPPNMLVQGCNVEYDDVVYAWNTILEPYLQ